MTASGQKIVTFRMATRSKRKGKEDVTIWWRVTIWGDRFDKLLPYLKKGSAVMVAGELMKPELYTDKGGQVQMGSLEVWASNIWFSPFGKGEKGGEVGENNMGYTPPGSPQPYSDNSPFAQTAPASFAAAGAFGGGPQPLFGQGPQQGFPEDDENDLPF
jgi:single-strand DNA-binding protein